MSNAYRHHHSRRAYHHHHVDPRSPAALSGRFRFPDWIRGPTLRFCADRFDCGPRERRDFRSCESPPRQLHL